MTNKNRIMVLAELPADTQMAFLRHLREFDKLHPGCTFQMMMSSADNISEMVQAVEQEPGMKVIDVFTGGDPKKTLS